MASKVRFVVLFAVALVVLEARPSLGSEEQCVEHMGECAQSSNCCGGCCRGGVCLSDPTSCKQSRSVQGVRDPCAGRCKPGEVCSLVPVNCIRAPCPPVARCTVTCNPACGPGKECYLERVVCIQAPCPPIPSCRPKTRN